MTDFVWQPLINAVVIFLLIYSFAVTGRFFYIRGYEDGVANRGQIFKPTKSEEQNEPD